MKLTKEANLKEKYYYTIGEASKIIGVKQSVLRYWEKVFNFHINKRFKSSHRRYTQNDIEKFLKIKYLLYEKKIKISKAKEILSSQNKSISLYELISELRKIVSILKGVGA